MKEPVADSAFEVKWLGVGRVGIRGIADHGGGINGFEGCEQRVGKFVGSLDGASEVLEICLVLGFWAGEAGIEMGKAVEELDEELAANLAEDIGVSKEFECLIVVHDAVVIIRFDTVLLRIVSLTTYNA